MARATMHLSLLSRTRRLFPLEAPADVVAAAVSLSRTRRLVPLEALLADEAVAAAAVSLSSHRLHKQLVAALLLLPAPTHCCP